MAKGKKGRRTGGRKRTKRETTVEDYRHEEAKRKNIPPAKIAAEGTVPTVPKARYYYSPRRPPELRFDPDGGPDVLPELLAKARRAPLTEEEARTLAEALRTHEPWLEWAEKREQHERRFFEVDPVALHIHERVSAQAILKVARRQDVQRDLFADPEQEYHEAVQFYRHDIDWTNRLILGDSLLVMSSLARREGLAGKVQMIYIDPPYGIKFASNFQPEVGRRDVKDREADLTRQPEMVRAYRDTWHLGTHSYLSYLRDRLVVARELLSDSGSAFVQIGDENVHRVRCLMDEVFGTDNFVTAITVKKTAGLSKGLMPEVADFLLSYAKEKKEVKRRTLFVPKEFHSDPAYSLFELPNGEHVRADRLTLSPRQILEGVLRYQILLAAGRTTAARSWSTNQAGMQRLLAAGRVTQSGRTLNYVRYGKDNPVNPLPNLWTRTASGSGMQKVYVVQTNTKVIERCVLMTTDPGDLVLDPTCGSGSTAYVAEGWGRRWITVDTSRVAIAIARQRLLTAALDRYRVRGESEHGTGDDTRPGVDPNPGFVVKTVPHITLVSIAQDTNLDPILAKHEPILDEKLAACNAALGEVSDTLRTELLGRLVAKQRSEGKRSITDADQRRWELPKKGETWEHWEVPFDTDPEWPQALQHAVTAYRVAWRAKMDEVNECIAANADQEELVDQPEVIPGVVRVSGPFTVEAVQPPEMSLGDVVGAHLEGKFAGEPEELEDTFDGEVWVMRQVQTQADVEAKNLQAYLDQMIRLLRMDGVRFPNNQQMTFTRLEPLEGGEPGLNAEGRWVPEGEEDSDPEAKATVCVAFGPQYGPVTAMMVEDVIRSANRMGYDDLVVAGFSFDGPAQAVIDEAQHPRLRIHMAHIAPSVNPAMNGLLKEQPGSQLFTVFGQPRVSVSPPNERGEYVVTMEGVDIYDPVNNVVSSTGASKVAAWFLDGDYDGRTFCITQAFFPDKSAWKKLARALKGVVDEEAFAAFSGTESLPFPAGKHQCVAVKVIDPRGNEVMRVMSLDGEGRTG